MGITDRLEKSMGRRHNRVIRNLMLQVSERASVRAEMATTTNHDHPHPLLNLPTQFICSAQIGASKRDTSQIPKKWKRLAFRLFASVILPQIVECAIDVSNIISSSKSIIRNFLLETDARRRTKWFLKKESVGDQKNININYYVNQPLGGSRKVFKGFSFEDVNDQSTKQICAVKKLELSMIEKEVSELSQCLRSCKNREGAKIERGNTNINTNTNTNAA